MSVACLTIDAFTDRPFAGNPAAVCLLENARDAGWMQAVAAELNLSETAFVRRLDDGFELRWFTPAVEVDLCGHATLAAAHALWSEGRAAPGTPIVFHTRSGRLTCSTDGARIELDFPALPVAPEPEDEIARMLEAALGVQPAFCGLSRYDALVLVDCGATLRAIEPDFRALAALPVRGVIVTSPADDGRHDFLSRFFAPAAGIDEDPVTGSAHCVLAPYWAARLDKDRLKGYQASARGGEVEMRMAGDRVVLGGSAVTVLKSELLA